MTRKPWDQHLARWMIRPLVGTRVTPNQITTASLLTGLAAAGGFALGDPVWSNWAAVAFAVCAFLDHADGELARLSGKASRFGQRYDRVVSMATKVALFIGIGYGLRDSALGTWALPMGLAAGTSIAAIFGLIGRVERQTGRRAAAQPALGGFEIEDLLYLIVPITWLGGLVPLLCAAVVGSPAFAVWMLWRWRRTTLTDHPEPGHRPAAN